MRHHQVDQHTHYENQRRKRKRRGTRKFIQRNNGLEGSGHPDSGIPKNLN